MIVIRSSDQLVIKGVKISDCNSSENKILYVGMPINRLYKIIAK